MIVAENMRISRPSFDNGFQVSRILYPLRRRLSSEESPIKRWQDKEVFDKAQSNAKQINTIHTRGARKLHGPRKRTSSQATAGSDFTSKASPGSEDVKKRLRLLSEVVLRTVKGSLAASFAIFAGKNGGGRGIRTPGGFRHGGFQDRCLKPLDHSSDRIYSCWMTIRV